MKAFTCVRNQKPKQLHVSCTLFNIGHPIHESRFLARGVVESFVDELAVVSPAQDPTKSPQTAGLELDTAGLGGVYEIQRN